MGANIPIGAGSVLPKKIIYPLEEQLHPDSQVVLIVGFKGSAISSVDLKKSVEHSEPTYNPTISEVEHAIKFLRRNRCVDRVAVGSHSIPARELLEGLDAVLAEARSKSARGTHKANTAIKSHSPFEQPNPLGKEASAERTTSPLSSLDDFMADVEGLLSSPTPSRPLVD